MDADDTVSIDEQPKTPTQWHAYWKKERDAAEKRLRSFQKQGNTVNRRFLDERKGGSRTDNDSGSESHLNLFHANISTLQSMLYGSTPRIDVSREHHDPDDDVARVASVLFQRMLQADIDPSGEDTPSVLKAVLQDRLLPGLGVARIRYDFTTSKQQVPDPVTGEMVEQEMVADEKADLDYVHWQDNLWGWSRSWKELPWWGFRSWLEKSEATTRFGKKIADELDYKNQLPTGGDKNDENYEEDQKSNVQKAEIWEFWHKTEKKVFWWSESADIILDAQDDPLGLDGFFPIPKPLTANVTTTLFEPRADYVIAQDLYNEIDELQSRISIITRAVKVVGVYDSSATGVKRMLTEAVENELIPVDNWAMFGEKGGLQGVIDWFPVGDVVATLGTLRQLLNETIELLNMVTGMSEIMSGSAGGQYTAAASNQIAAKMGSIRVQALQEEFASFASDLEALKAEVISKHFSPEAIMRQSNAQFLPEADKDKIGPAIQLMKSQTIKWRIDIRPESIAMVDYAQLKSERTEFLTAMATYLQSAQAVVKSVPGSLPILLEMLKWGMAGFKGSNYLEGTMDAAIDMAKKAPPEGKEDDGKAQDGQLKLQLEQMKQQGAQQKQQGEMQKIQAKGMMDMQTQQAKIQSEIAKMNADSERDMTMEQMRSRSRLQEIAADLESSINEIQANMQANLTVEKAQAVLDIQGQTVEHAHNMTEIHAQSKGREA